MQVGNAAEFIPCLSRARSAGLKLAFHVAEVIAYIFFQITALVLDSELSTAGMFSFVGAK
jgi:hypothetical protein